MSASSTPGKLPAGSADRMCEWARAEGQAWPSHRSASAVGGRLQHSPSGQAERVLVLVSRSGCVVSLHMRSGKHTRYVPSDVIHIYIFAFVKDHDEQTVGRKRWIRKQRLDVGLQPGIRRGQA